MWGSWFYSFVLRSLLVLREFSAYVMIKRIDVEDNSYLEVILKNEIWFSWLDDPTIHILSIVFFLFLTNVLSLLCRQRRRKSSLNTFSGQFDWTVWGWSLQYHFGMSHNFCIGSSIGAWWATSGSFRPASRVMNSSYLNICIFSLKCLTAVEILFLYLFHVQICI